MKVETCPWKFVDQIDWTITGQRNVPEMAGGGIVGTCNNIMCLHEWYQLSVTCLCLELG